MHLIVIRRDNANRIFVTLAPDFGGPRPLKFSHTLYNFVDFCIVIKRCGIGILNILPSGGK